MTVKYYLLQQYLTNLPTSQRDVTLSFMQIERIINDTLPASASKHRAWWANEREGMHSHAHAWMDEGWKVDTVDQRQKWVLFRRVPGPKRINMTLVRIPVEPSSQITGSSFKIVIQCAGKKYENAGRLTTLSGEKVLFSAHPERYTLQGKCCRPDDIREGTDSTWRAYLGSYNQQGSNPNHLFPAGELAKAPIYRALIRKFDATNVFILSAGWGLVRSDYLLPYYDITFSNQGKPYSKRRPSDRFDDFNQLSDVGIQPDETIYFFGGQSYLPLYLKLTRNIVTRKVIYHSHDAAIQIQGYICIPSPYPGSQNWHYKCAQGFIDGMIQK